MSWTVACFCGTVFESPATHCPTCHTPVPETTTGGDAPEPSDLTTPAEVFSARGHLERLAIDHAALSEADVITMSYTLHGWWVVPRTAADAPPIVARVWLLAALNTRGRYSAPCQLGHPADVEDGGGSIDSVILMAVIQRHFLTSREPAWDDGALASQLGLDAGDIERAQRALEQVARLPLRPPRPAPLGQRWWRSHAGARHTSGSD